MPSVQNSLSNLLSRVEGWTHSSKAIIVITLFIFAAIPLTVIGVFSLGNFSSNAASSSPTKLSPSGPIQSSAPLFTWECNCSARDFKIQLREKDDNFNLGSWQKDVSATSNVVTTRYGGWESFNYQAAPANLKPGVTYYWKVSCGSGSCTNPKVANFVVLQKDSEKPTIPNSLEISNFGQNTFTVSWENSTDNVAVTKYIVLETVGDSSPIRHEVQTSSYQPPTYIGSMKYSFSVAASDASGNTSDFSEKIFYIAADKDTDKDGFFDSQEVYFGTNVNVVCKGRWSWPPDLNDDGIVNDKDVQIITKNIGLVRTSVSSIASRYDLDQSGVITQSDVDFVKSYLGKTC